MFLLREIKNPELTVLIQEFHLGYHIKFNNEEREERESVEKTNKHY